MRAHPILATFAAGALLAACGGGSTSGSSGGGGGGGGGTTGFSLKGRLSSALRSESPGSPALSAASVATVVAFSPNRYWTSSVTGGAFDIQVDPSEPVGLVFAGASSEFLGAMVLPSGFAAIPLQARTSGVTTVDLGTLVAGATTFTPGHDPVGTEIPLATSDRTALRFLEGTFGSVVRRPDADGDGKVDVLQGRFYRPFLMYFVDAGTFGAGTTATPATPAFITGFRFGVALSDSSTFPATATLNGPPGSQITGFSLDLSGVPGTTSAIYTSVLMMYPFVPPVGVYTVGAGSRTLTFDIPDQSEATANVAVAVPAVTLNPDGTVAKVAWTYQLGDQSGSVKPEALIDNLILQIDGDGTANAPPCPANGGVGSNQDNRAYNSPNVAASVTEHVLACQNIKWSAVRAIYMAYNDVYGNHMVVTWRK
ncbi:MAG TPA: hypothetical protein VFM53_15830 [Anaeromyxobacteraceae bacterium]|nr:hypothetical protein [Anaeromyxobacteraceae bacterium]